MVAKKQQLPSARIGGRSVSHSEGCLDQQFGTLLGGSGIDRADRNPAVLRNIRDPRVQEMAPIREKERQYVAAFAPGFVQCGDDTWNATRSRNAHYRAIESEDNHTVLVPRTADNPRFRFPTLLIFFRLLS